MSALSLVGPTAFCSQRPPTQGGGVEAFAQGKPIAGIKVLVTEIEGILNVAYRAPTGKAGNSKALLGFAIESAEKRTYGPGTLFLTTEFNRYLLNYMFAN